MIQHSSVSPPAIGVDFGIRKSNFCIHDASGNRDQEGVISSSGESVAEYFSSQEPS